MHLLKNAAHVAAANVAHLLVMDSAANVASSTAAPVTANVAPADAPKTRFTRVTDSVLQATVNLGCECFTAGDMQSFKEACALAKRTPNAKWSTVAVNNRNVAIATRKRLHEQLITAQNTALTKGETILAAQGQATLDELAEIHTDVRDLRTGQDGMQKKLDDLHNVAILDGAKVVVSRQR